MGINSKYILGPLGSTLRAGKGVRYAENVGVVRDTVRAIKGDLGMTKTAGSVARAKYASPAHLKYLENLKKL